MRRIRIKVRRIRIQVRRIRISQPAGRHTHLEDGAGAGAAAAGTVGFLPMKVILRGWLRQALPARNQVFLF